MAVRCDISVIYRELFLRVRAALSAHAPLLGATEPDLDDQPVYARLIRFTMTPRPRGPGTDAAPDPDLCDLEADFVVSARPEFIESAGEIGVSRVVNELAGALDEFAGAIDADHTVAYRRAMSSIEYAQTEFDANASAVVTVSGLAQRAAGTATEEPPVVAIAPIGA